MKLLALASLLSVAVADWTLYCGSSIPMCSNIDMTKCTDGTEIATGDDAILTCADLGATYDYCYLEADETYWKGVAFESATCEVIPDKAGYLESNGFFNGECTSAGTWQGYYIVENL
ncbi:hypothetical protein ASPZODRAFT_142111 [Penicilliopsis zonata CBS 506.65]|uniref:Cyanovirin-N domain-containing protein n=1 Tax=Penicilliopsis zonata CBS 506.65 TaxID=1073090 RepID=A0A1L9SJK6_9EURO|nr:hypothetical protein ASPZODRAFT_142111 [Penicilliopsis zonata CBS 506.65]OJJ47378.1 hypothetical protein ASPZODRAFT_142111 [Penicilliopsis zonata CBS 506.65]